MADIKTIGVLGAGQMGNGIAHVAAQNGYDVILQDIAPEALTRAQQTMTANMGREVTREKISEADKEAALARITTTTELAEAAGAQLVIEAATEDEALKQQLYAQLAPHLKQSTIVASNTSSISITKLAASLPDPARFIGMHFFYPVPMMALVELIRGMATSQETYQAARQVVERMQKTPVVCKDSPGFIANRIVIPMLNEAVFALQEGVGSVEDIDTAMKLGLAHPMGPLTLADYIGLDTVLAVMRVLYNEFGDSKYRPCPLLVKLVEAGWLGVKSGRGFYDYSQQPPVPTL
ncbi:MAG: 3-hydroxybutyryl-CoA dehydrogenase [SAR324 cluster bacterium]|nr:3-hydroxybutyryl-CoA dehydrogenase [SAR324 cluster bacterium]